MIIVYLRSVHQLLVTANVVPSSPILVTLMIEMVSSSNQPNGVTFQETAFFLVTAVKTSNITCDKRDLAEFRALRSGAIVEILK
jgi:hypothetical protein